MTPAGRTDRLVTPAGPVGLRRWGTGAPAVVLLHGAGGNRDSLAPLGDALAAHGLAVAAVSLPGRGDSGAEPCTAIGEMARWLADVLAALAPDGTVLLGHSMGGGVAIEAALATGAQLEGLVLVATGARLRVHPDILDRAADRVASGQGLADVAATSLRPDAPTAIRDHVLASSGRTPGPTALADWQTVDRFDRLHDLDGLGLPVLAVAGADDHMTPPRYAHFVADHARHAESVVLPDGGHWLPVERAAEVADLAAGFVRRVARPRAPDDGDRLLVRAQRRRDWRPGEDLPPDPGTDPPFVHLSRPDQIPEICRRHHADADDLVLLVVDSARLPEALAWEDLADEGQPFPHLYAPLPADAIIDVIDYPPRPDGTFDDPEL